MNMTTTPKISRDQLLMLDDEALCRACRVDVFRGSGPGGQKRNVTESAVRITHAPSGLTGSSDATRSQHRNRLLAVRELRRQIVLNWREQLATGGDAPAAPTPAGKHIHYDGSTAVWLARVLDTLMSVDFQVSRAAALVGLSTGQLVRHLSRDPLAWQYVNHRRLELGLPALRQS